VIGWVVAIGGPPGSGKSTAGRLVARELGLEYRSVGEEFRAEAKRHGMDLEAFDRYAEAHPEVDRALDRRMQELARPGRVIDGRIQGVLCRRNGVPVRSIVVTAEEGERARRIAERDGGTVEEARAGLRAREASERARFAKFYGIDLDRETPDLTVDSTHAPPDDVARTIVAFVQPTRGAGRPG
jgi:CMP/dCMP kinase